MFRDAFMQDAPPELARSVWERLVPQPFPAELARRLVEAADD